VADGRAGDWLKYSPLHSIRKEIYGKENLSLKKSSSGSSKRSGSLRGYRRLANQPRFKSAGQARTCVETQESKTPESKTQENKKACSEQSWQCLSLEKVGGSICQRPSGSQSPRRLEDLPQAET